MLTPAEYDASNQQSSREQATWLIQGQERNDRQHTRESSHANEFETFSTLMLDKGNLVRYDAAVRVIRRGP